MEISLRGKQYCVDIYVIEAVSVSNLLSRLEVRKIPFSLLPKVKEELERMLEAGIIEEVTEPTDWFAPMVPVLKPNGKVRLCDDLRILNRAVKRERYPKPLPGYFRRCYPNVGRSKSVFKTFVYRS